MLEISYAEWTPDGLLRHVVYLAERQAEAGAFAGLDFDAAIASVGTQEPMVRRLFPG